MQASQRGKNQVRYCAFLLGAALISVVGIASAVKVDFPYEAHGEKRMIARYDWRRTVWLSLSALMISFFAMAAGGSAFAQNANVKTPSIVAIGDIHGDYDAYWTILTDADLIDKRGRWKGGETILVQTGDLPDRGPDTRKIIEHLMKLEKQAAKKGGKIIPLIGNHDAMNVTGDLRYVDPGEYEAFTGRTSKRLRDRFFDANKTLFEETYRQENPEITDKDIRVKFETAYPLGYVEHRQAWAPTGPLGKWVASHDAVRIVGDTLFVHGGLSMAYTEQSIAEINDAVRAGLTGAGPDVIVTDENGPLWYRGNTSETPEGAVEIEAVLAAFGVSRLVVGHTPSIKGIRSLYDGRVIVIDTGSSAYYKGTRSFLRINGDEVVAVDDGVPRKLAP